MTKTPQKQTEANTVFQKSHTPSVLSASSHVPKNHIRVTVNNKFVSCLIDTGADISCMSDDLYKDLCLDDVCPISDTDMTVRVANSKLAKVSGKVKLKVTIGETEITQEFFLIPNLNSKMNLGQDFLQTQEAIIKCCDNTLELKKVNTTVPLFCTNQRSSVARIVNRITIAKRSERLIPVKVKKTNSPVTCLLEPTKSLTYKQLAGAKCVTIPAEGVTHFRVMNPTDEPITLYKHQPVAIAHPVNSSDVVMELHDVDKSVSHIPSLDAINKTSTSTNYANIAKEMDFDLHKSSLSVEQQESLLTLIGKNRDVFAKDISELGSTDIYHHRIDTGNATPVRQMPYRQSPKMREVTEKEIEVMLAHDIIEPSVSCWTSPVVLIKKKDGEYRFAVDYRKLNKVTVRMQQPLPKMEDVIDMIGNAAPKIYSVLDLASGFWQIPLHPDSKEKTAFITHQGIYQFKKLPFGLMNSPAAFTMVMSEVLRNINWKYALIYVDDIIVFSSSFEQHLQHLDAIFERMRTYGLRLKPSKCQFAVEKVHYLGHIFSKEGVETDPAKTEAIQSFPTPRRDKDVRSFLGVCNYYRKFVPNFSKIVSPLNYLLKKDVKFTWDDACEKAFSQMKKALTSSPILAYPDFNKEFILYTDASTYSIGYVLGQLDQNNKERVIAYGGRSLKKEEKNWPPTHLEGLALVAGILHFREYLANKHFTVFTDHAALKTIQTNTKTTGRLARWAVHLEEFDFTVKHKPGERHTNADALSRRTYPDNSNDSNEEEVPTLNTSSLQQIELEYEDQTVEAPHTSSLNTLQTWMKAENSYRQISPLQVTTEIFNITEEDLKGKQGEDEEINDIIRHLESGDLPEDENKARRIHRESQDCSMTDGILYHFYYPRGKGHMIDRGIKQLVVPKSMRNDVLTSYHDDLTGCHQGEDRTFQAIRLKYFWPTMFKDVQQFVKTCETCQRTKLHYHGKVAPLCSLPVGEPFSRIHLDFIGPLPKTPEGHQHILLIVDSFTKWCEAFPTSSSESAVVANILYSEIICRYGAPRSIVTDRGQCFMSKLVKELCSLFEIKKISTSSYHPQTNATCERLNSTIEKGLRAYCDEKQSNWSKILPSIMHAYRTTPATRSTTLSPYYLLFGRECMNPIDVALLPPQNLGKKANEHLEEIIENHKISQQIASENIKKSQQQNSKVHNRKAKIPQFHLGDRVWLSCHKPVPGLSRKLAEKWIGPYYICDEFENFTYTLKNCETHHQLPSRVHANRLKPYEDPDTRLTNPPPPVEVDSPVPSAESTDNSESATTEAQNEQAHSTQIHTQENQTAWYEVDRIIRSHGPPKDRWYLVRWKEKRNGKWSDWVREKFVSQALIRQFQQQRTQKGRLRKLRKKHLC